MTEQGKVLVCFFAALLLTVIFLSGATAKWAAAALLVIAMLMGIVLAIIGALFICLCWGLYQERLRAARAQAERPAWLPPVEAWPEIEPEPARIERLQARNGKL